MSRPRGWHTAYLRAGECHEGDDELVEGNDSLTAGVDRSLMPALVAVGDSKPTTAGDRDKDAARGTRGPSIRARMAR